MDYQTIKDRRKANPFQPFRVVMTDGKGFDIHHPNLIWPGRSTVLVGIQDPSEPAGVFGHYVGVAMLHVVQIEPLSPPVAAAP
ncbi:MAG: hypothetical protein K2P78_08390 [Gemmataceae bacterium]|nr:hypothetical protein [Gemmataceae bacterium]